MKYVRQYLDETREVLAMIDRSEIAKAINLIQGVSSLHRMFILGVGGSAANASHAVNDFRKLCNIDCYAPTDNVAELTARTNDDGWEHVFEHWLETSRLGRGDMVFVLSVGGGSHRTSQNLVLALKYAKDVGAMVVCIVGRDGGFAKTVADVCIQIPTISTDRITPHVEEFQGIICHLLASHPLLKG